MQLKQKRMLKRLRQTAFFAAAMWMILTLQVHAAAAGQTKGTQKADSTQNPKIDYTDSMEIQSGTVRYVQQNAGEYFYSDYWGGWAGSAPHECGTSSISMALSYVGINKTPADILNAHNGTTFFGSWGETEFLKPDAETGMENYLQGNGTYSPVIIHLPNYSQAGHYVVLVGKLSDHVYQALDPWNEKDDAVWEITINGNNVSYYKGTGVIDQTYQYYYSPKEDKVSDADIPARS